MTDRDLYLRIRLELRRVTHGLDQREALEAIMAHIRERRGERPNGETLH